MMRQLYKVGLIKYSEWQDFPKVYNWRMRLDYALFNLNMVLLEGIGFGYRFPELTEKLTQNAVIPAPAQALQLRIKKR